MKNNLTELVFILDRSGSMGGLETDTIGGFNSLLEKQRKEEGEALMTTVLFDDQYELLHDRVNLKGVSPLTEKEYYTRGSTALLDALGQTINKIGDAHKHTRPEECPGKTMVVVITDGYENASSEFSPRQIKHMVQLEQEKYHWEFLFIGANIDAITAAKDLGIRADRAVNYMHDAQGQRKCYEAVGEAARCMRVEGCLSEDEWRREVDRDYRVRGGPKHRIKK